MLKQNDNNIRNYSNKGQEIMINTLPIKPMRMLRLRTLTTTLRVVSARAIKTSITIVKWSGEIPKSNRSNNITWIEVWKNKNITLVRRTCRRTKIKR